MNSLVLHVIPKSFHPCALKMELKARLSALENQINSLQSLLSNPRSYHDENYNNQNVRNLDKSQDNLRNILMSKRTQECGLI